MRIPYRLKKIWWKIFPPKSPIAKTLRVSLKQLNSVEIGGPSPYFGARGFLPLYDVLQSCDNAICAPSNEHAAYPADHSPYLNSLPGKNYLMDASEALPGKYQCILSSHVLEHLSNPLKTLECWKQNLIEPGFLLAVVPYKENTFDHRRPITSFNHLLEDYDADTTESDQTHLEEIRQLHDFSKHNFKPNAQEYNVMLDDNHFYRVAHHHVFDLDLLEQCFLWADFEIVVSETIDSISNLVLAKLKS